MIRGTLFEPVNSQGQPIGVATPYIVATLIIPRLNIKGSIPFLVDTGADATSLHLRDAVNLLGMRGINLLRGELSATGIGGSAKYFKEPTEIVFHHDDNTLEGFQFDLRVAIPIKSWWKPRQRKLQSLQLRIPSVLGRDILREFRLVIDFHSKEFFLDHS